MPAIFNTYSSAMWHYIFIQKIIWIFKIVLIPASIWYMEKQYWLLKNSKKGWKNISKSIKTLEKKRYESKTFQWLPRSYEKVKSLLPVLWEKII